MQHKGGQKGLQYSHGYTQNVTCILSVGDGITSHNLYIKASRIKDSDIKKYAHDMTS